MKKALSPRAQLILSMLIFGTIGVLRRSIPFPSSVVALVRAVIGLAYLLILRAVRHQPVDRAAVRRNLGKLLILGAMLAANWIFLFEAYNYTSVAAATMCYYMAPVCIILLSVPVFGEKITPRKGICAAVAVFGMVLVSDVLTTGLHGAKGLVFGLIAAVLYAVIVIINRTLKDISAEDRTIMQFAASSLVMLPYVLLTENLAALEATPRVLLLLLIAMSTFRSPSVALMPDVTIKPLRSKGNAIINLMGTFGGIIVLGLGIVFSTGAVKNSLMSYTTFFAIIAGIMLVSLAIFRWKVDEPRFVEEMEAQSRRFHLDLNENDDVDDKPASRKLSAAEKRSLILILASVVFWFMGYNAVTSKYSVYAGKVLSLDYNTTLMIANAAAIVAYLPVGIVASKIGRRKTILIGITMLTASFIVAAFVREGSPIMLMNAMFALAGIGWATINVNSFPMVVELSRGGDVGKYTGFYYTASMAAQTVTPYLSGLLMDKAGMTSLFPYAAVFVFLSSVTMLFVRHGDSRPIPAGKLESFDVGD